MFILQQMDMGEPLDTNAELVTVGWSNVLSGNLHRLFAS
jgi:MFS superfamily sulfate permease-like transporter